MQKYYGIAALLVALVALGVALEGRLHPSVAPEAASTVVATATPAPTPSTKPAAKPAPAEPTLAVVQEPASGEYWTVIAQCYKSTTPGTYEKALTDAQRLVRKGIDARVIDTSAVGGLRPDYYAVACGVFRTKAGAKTQLPKVVRAGVKDAYIRHVLSATVEAESETVPSSGYVPSFDPPATAPSDSYGTGSRVYVPPVTVPRTMNRSDCYSCDGTGLRTCYMCDGSGFSKYTGYKCLTCDGRGLVKCTSCNGRGYNEW